MRNHLLFVAAAAALLAAGAPAIAQMEGGVGGGTGGSPQDARETDQAYEELRSEKKISGTNPSQAPDELAVGADMVKQGQFADAIPHLEAALAKNPDNSITLIYLGFAHRMMGAIIYGPARDTEYKKALGYYQQAVKIDPRNTLLHEYLGKLDILMHDQASAQNELNTLGSLCPNGCDSRDALSRAMADYMATVAPISGPAQGK